MADTQLVILVAHSSALTRGLLCEHLRIVRGITAVHEASTGAETLELAAQHRPHVILVSTQLSDMTGFSTARLLGSAHPVGRVIFLSVVPDAVEAQHARVVGASGYLTCTERPESVVVAVRAVAAGGECFPELLGPSLPAPSTLDPPHGNPTGPTSPRVPSARLRELTKRELEVLRFIAAGLAKRQIAQVLELSIKTVDRHTANLMNKLDIHDRVGLTRYAIREGLIDP